ncbi:MAG: hypothetical protein EZS28_011764 [Streblomastix strix]|uniref:ATPase AAA-type core domain-containing protein n=1 Tax=Streblomastix strix TaxID=222440 RepID=A0A5J4WCP8_9EUKA|nr:MAG: hypothetical protein EZS28_011764 [Streblomastix strix]
MHEDKDAISYLLPNLPQLISKSHLPSDINALAISLARVLKDYNYDYAKAQVAKGALILGKHATGKTTLAHAFADVVGCECLCIRLAELVASGLGDTERAIRQVFKVARQRSPCVILIDDIHALVPSEIDDDEEEENKDGDEFDEKEENFDKLVKKSPRNRTYSSFVSSIISQLCAELDAPFSEHESFIVLATAPSLSLVPMDLIDDVLVQTWHFIQTNLLCSSLKMRLCKIIKLKIEIKINERKKEQKKEPKSSKKKPVKTEATKLAKTQAPKPAKKEALQQAKKEEKKKK